MNPAVDGCCFAGATRFIVLYCVLALRDSLRVRFNERVRLDPHIGDLLFEWSRNRCSIWCPPYSTVEYLAPRTNPPPRGEFAIIA
jgi:hypothetical protein